MISRMFFNSKTFRTVCVSMLLTAFVTSLLYAAISWYFSSQILIASRDLAEVHEIQSINATAHSEPTILRLENSPNTLWLFEKMDTNSCAIILIHGWGANRMDVEKYKRPFASTQCVIVTYDLRAHGTDENSYSTGGIREKRDLLAIHAFLKTQLGLHNSQIGWFGVSLGGSTALQAAALANPAFVIADSPFQDWPSAIFERGEDMYGSWVHMFRPGVNLLIYWRAGIWFDDASVLTNAPSIEVPVLLIHSRADTDTASYQSHAIFDALPSTSTRFHHTDWGAAHAKDFDVAPERYSALINQFLSDFAPQLF